MERIISLVGLFVMIGIGYVMSSAKKNIRWKTVINGVLLQFVLGAVILKTQLGQSFFNGANDVAISVLGYTRAGAEFLFGPLVQMPEMEKSFGIGHGFCFAFMVLPTIIFMSALMGVLYHLGIMQKFVKMVAFVMIRLMGTSGAESLVAAANIFLGQTEAPLVIRPYIESLTQSELLAMMVAGMATLAGGVLAAYVGLGIDAGHLLAASVMSAPAALVMSKLILPELGKPVTSGAYKMDIPATTSNVVDAAAAGASDGLQLALNVGAMLVAFIALVALVNGIMAYVGGLFGFPQFGLELIFRYVFAPIAWVLGVPGADALAVGGLLGKRLVLNEFVAYIDLKALKDLISPRSFIIATYALCGFANFGSIGIQIGGIGALAPTRRKDLALLGMRALIAGTLACFMTACIAGIFID
jgi:CNT family concentrative nucleoside transporter